MLTTELPNNLHADLDLYPNQQLVDALINDQFDAVQAVHAAAPQINQAVAAALPRILAGGRLIYVGAGTSGRLGVLDSVELFPTFSWPHERALALLAGGRDAMFLAIEGAEDDTHQGALDMAQLHPMANDVVLLLAASGGTPYVLGALGAAKKCGALTVGISNNADAPLVLAADMGITLATGAEIISGSTRLKAGTAQKITLNTFSSALMVRLNKVYGNLMVDVKPTNAKLIQRTVNLTTYATACSEQKATETLARCEHQVKIAIVAIKKNISVEQARACLIAVNGSVREALRAD